MRLPDTSNKAIILSNWSKTGVNTRKAPAFRQGLLQFDFSGLMDAAEI